MCAGDRCLDQGMAAVTWPKRVKKSETLRRCLVTCLKMPNSNIDAMVALSGPVIHRPC